MAKNPNPIIAGVVFAILATGAAAAAATASVVEAYSGRKQGPPAKKDHRTTPGR